MLSQHPNAEVIYAGDFNVHHTEWLNSTHTDEGVGEAHSFSIIHDLEQIIKHPTRVPDSHGQAANTLDLFLTANPIYYSYTVSSPLGLSDHCLVSVFSSFSTPPPIPPTQCRIWLFNRIQRAEMSDFLKDFPWEDYCFRSRDPDQVAPKVAEVLTSGMEAYIPSSTKTFSPSKPWFDHACSLAIQARERAYQSYEDSPSKLSLNIF